MSKLWVVEIEPKVCRYCVRCTLTCSVNKLFRMRARANRPKKKPTHIDGKGTKKKVSKEIGMRVHDLYIYLGTLWRYKNVVCICIIIIIINRWISLAAEVIPPIPTHFSVVSVCLSVVCHICAPCLNHSTDLDAICQIHLRGPMTHCVRWGSRPWPAGQGTIWGGTPSQNMQFQIAANSAFCQITLVLVIIIIKLLLLCSDWLTDLQHGERRDRPGQASRCVWAERSRADDSEDAMLWAVLTSPTTNDDQTPSPFTHSFTFTRIHDGCWITVNLHQLSFLARLPSDTRSIVLVSVSLSEPASNACIQSKCPRHLRIITYGTTCNHNNDNKSGSGWWLYIMTRWTAAVKKQLNETPMWLMWIVDAFPRRKS